MCLYVFLIQAKHLITLTIISCSENSLNVTFQFSTVTVRPTELDVFRGLVFFQVFCHSKCCGTGRCFATFLFAVYIDDQTSKLQKAKVGVLYWIPIPYPESLAIC